MQKRQIDQVSFVKARKAQKIAELSGTDIIALIGMISGLQQQVSDLSDAFIAHTHNYTDIDNVGTVQNKTTAIPV